ncbi:branched-chain amino acid ABC transporter permease [soil metagenome]|nr:branched-chain amino acid ABC transporter permease [Deinococcota bacterium]
MRRHGFTLAVLLLLGVAPLIAEAAGERFLVSALARVAIYGLAALSLNFILGYGGLVSFGHAAFLGVGAYTVGILSYHAFYGEPVLGFTSEALFNQALFVWPLAMFVSALFALLIGVISLRTRGVYFIMITLAFAQMLYFFALTLRRYGGEDGLALWWGPNAFGTLDLSDRMLFFYVAYGLLVLWVFLFHRIVHSRFGRVLRGLKSNELRMRALGYRPLPYRLAAFCIAGAVGGLAGAMLANLSEFVSPGVMHWSRSGQLMVMVIMGGMNTLVGPVVGAGAFLLMEEALIAYTEHWGLFLGPILILIVLFAKRGLAGLFSRDD